MALVSKKKYLARRITDYVGTIIFACLLLFFWQLYRSPIPLPFLKPYIVKALNHDSQEYGVDVESVNLELVRSIQPIKIIARNVEYKKTNEDLIIKAPKIEISFSVKALIRGIISPSSVVFDAPSVEINTRYEGVSDNQELSINEKKIAYYVDVFNKFLERFNSEDMSYPETYIDYIAIKNADFNFKEVDLERNWSVQKANYIFDRDRDAINVGLDGNFMIGEKPVPFDLDIKYITENEKIDIDLAFSNFVPAEALEAFATDEEKKKFYKIEVPLSGKIDILLSFKKILKNKNNISKSLDNAIEMFNFKFEGEDGRVIFSDNEAYNYDINAFTLQGEVDSGLNDIKIKNAKVNLGDKSALVGLHISGFRDLLLKKSLQNLQIKLKTEVEQLSFEELPKYWPRYIAEDAWNWVKYSIYSGMIKDAAFEFDFGYDKKSKSIAFQNLSGTGNVEKASIDYLEGMPHAQNVYGKVDFYKDKIIVDVEKGEAAGNFVTGGKVVLYDLDKYDNFITIELKAKSKIAETLKFIDNPPLEFAKEMGVEPETIQGNAEVDLKLDFELKKNLTTDEVKVDVKSRLFDVEMTDIFEDKPIKAKKLDLSVNNKHLEIKGAITVDDIAMNLNWNKPFTNTKYMNKYELSFVLDDKMKKKYGLDYSILKKPYIEGNFNVKADIFEYAGDKYLLNVHTDLTQNMIDYSFLGFKKNKGENGRLELSIDVEKNKLKKVKNIRLSKNDFIVESSLDLDKTGAVSTIDISKVKGPRTNAKAKIMMSQIKNKDFIKVNISGISYDITKLFEHDFKSQTGDEIDREAAEENLKKLPDMDINIAVDSLWTNDEIPITNFAGITKIRNGIGFLEVKMVGNYAYDKDSNFRFEYLPRPNDEFVININSTDAGKALKVLRLYDYMVGGNLRINARREPSGKIIGYARIRNFNIKNTNVFAKIISMASLSGIMNTISGEGIAFSHFDAGFDFRYGILELHEAKAFGNVLGISANGYFDYDTNAIGITGMLAPAYSINRFLAQIPLVGSLLSGKDGTVFAANYSVLGTAEDPKVKIDPLSAISPNSIKEMFSKKDDE
ncbi:MAG: AsmA-like C-terminal domain-containing protein [Alphaproteobacteria bacterium]